MTNEDFPARGFSLVQPTIVETKLTGWIATVQFTRLGHTYAIKFVGRNVECQRDGKPIEWQKLNNSARGVAHKAADRLKKAASIAAA